MLLTFQQSGDQNMEGIIFKFSSKQSKFLQLEKLSMGVSVRLLQPLFKNNILEVY